MKKCILLIALFSFLRSGTQNGKGSSSHKLQVGIELDVLPYALDGYFGAGWIGKDHIRIRILTANVH